MPNMTRARAQALLNKREMTLYDDSRINGLRNLDPAGVAKRVSLAREARDRARDLLQRQKLALRASTGSKRGTGVTANERSKEKVELLADILTRFREHAPVARQRAVAAGGGSATTRKPATKKTATKTAATKKTATKKTAAKKTATKKTAVRKAGVKQAAETTPTTKKSATTKAAKKKTSAKTSTKAQANPGEQGSARGTGRKASTPGAKSSRKMPTARQALASTRKLLRAKQAEAKAPKPWETLAAGTGQVQEEGYQSTEAAMRAQELHEAEMHRPAQLGEISSHVRREQGRRDRRRAP